MNTLGVGLMGRILIISGSNGVFIWLGLGSKGYLMDFHGRYDTAVVKKRPLLQEKALRLAPI